MGENSVCIDVQDISKTFGNGSYRISALNHVSLKIYFGELTMIVGPSGCGKTTLLSTIAGTLHSDSGKVYALNQDLTSMNDELLTSFRAENIGFIFQQFHLIPTLTALENIAIPLLLLGRPREEAFAKSQELLNQIDMGDKTNNLPKQLSGGQQQRIAIARAIVHNPKIIICDEPTSALDYQTGIKIMNLLQNATKGIDRSVIVVTHDHRIFDYASRIIEMDDGCIKSSTAK